MSLYVMPPVLSAISIVITSKVVMFKVITSIVNQNETLLRPTSQKLFLA